MKYDLENYRKLLRGGLDAGYRFVGFSSLPEPSAAKGGSDGAHRCLLRHDVDADLGATVRMAEVERELEIASTYFVMTRSPLYNVLSRHSHACVTELLQLGHGLGLHYDQGFRPGREIRLEAAQIDAEAELLEQEFSCRVHAVSFHQPGPAVLQGRADTGIRVNTYDAVRLAGIDYYSDSNRQLAVNAGQDKLLPEQFFGNLCSRSLQLLIHPMWWVYDELDTRGVWDRALRSNFEYAQQQLLETERAYGDRRQLSVMSLPQ